MRRRGSGGGGELAALAEHRLDSGAGDRPREDIALDLVAAKGADELKLLVGRDALRDRLHAQAAGERDDGPDDGGAFGIRSGDRLDEASIDLERIEIGAPQIAERGIAGAEIVHRQLDAEALDLVQDLLGGV